MKNERGENYYLGTAGDSPFRLDDRESYRRWRAAKLENYPAGAAALMVGIGDPLRPTAAELNEITALVAKTNMAIYTANPGAGDEKSALLNFCGALGLHRITAPPTAAASDDNGGIAELSVSEGGVKGDYIPYTDRPLGWHTDGCYTAGADPIRGFVLHCVRAAARGGGSFLLDPEIAYIRLRDEDPDFIAGLMLADALTIPANIENGVEIRPRRTGPVFSTDPQTGALHMRYTARKRHVAWRRDARISGARDILDRLLDGGADHVFRLRLEPGWGLVCNNVLHGRTGFTDGTVAGQKRLLYRLYYNDRVSPPAAPDGSFSP